MGNVFPKINQQAPMEGALSLPTPLRVRAEAGFEEVAAHLSELITLLYGIPTEIVEEGGKIALCRRSMAEEAYAIEVTEEGAVLSASGERGAGYAASTLVQLIERRETGFVIPAQVIRDQPYLPVRGIHAYMPAREDLPEFLRIVDALAFLKMNTMILEIGGAMEYRRHPEINEAWVKFCDTLDHKLPFSEKYRHSRALQRSDIYWKDSCHTEMADGSYLTQEEVKAIAAHCRKRGIEVIPELQAFSHSYYLTLAHREIAERQDDAFPDTYCPLNEKSYELYFEVAEEVIEVLHPRMVSVGHDELRVLGFCDRCRERSGHELVAYELNRLHAFYKEKGIRVAMWGDTAQYFINYLGGEYGGIEVNKPRYGHPYRLPATYECLKDIPSDILMLDWFHSQGWTSEDRYAEYGHEIIYGNFYGTSIADWDKRSRKAGMRGAEVSTWCPANEEMYARDGIFRELGYSAYLLWNENCNNESCDEISKGFLRVAPTLRAIVRGQAPLMSRGESASVWFAGEEREGGCRLRLSDAELYDEAVRRALRGMGDQVWGVPFRTGWTRINPDGYANRLLFLHRARQEMPFAASHAYREESDWTLGAYSVLYEDGDYEIVPLYYGRQMGNEEFRLSRGRDGEGVRGAELDAVTKAGTLGERQPACYFRWKSAWTGSLCYSTTPLWSEDGAAFVYEWTNPHPEKKIVMLKTMVLNHTPEQEVDLFGIVAIQ